MDGERLERFDGVHGHGEVISDPEILDAAGPELFVPEAWPGRAEPVGDGGRGAAWFVEDGFGPCVLRHYRRGGQAARISRDRYLWLGRDRVRSFVEFRLMAWARAQGASIPAPLAACYWRNGLAYRAALLVERVVDSVTLAERMAPGRRPPPWTRVGAAIGTLHRLGVEHADLNAHNILVTGDDRVWLIDFDRGRRRGGPGGWCERNLQRLERSLWKLAPRSPAVGVGLAGLREGYVRVLAQAPA